MLFENFRKNRARSRSREIEEVTEIETYQEKEGLILVEPMDEKRLRYFRFAALAVFCVLAIRVFYLQILKGDYYLALARENRIRYAEIKAPRGLIFDRNGKKLVQNIPSFDVILIPADLSKDTQKRKKEIEDLAQLLSLNEQSLKGLVNVQGTDSLNPVLVKENVNKEESLIFMEKKNKFPGFQLEKTAVRNYEKGNYFSAIIGYTGKINNEELERNPQYSMTDYIGKVGVEASYEEYLRGKNGRQKVEVDSSGNIKKNLGREEPVNGNDLLLTIDANLQEKIISVIERKLEETKTRTAAAVAMDPRNGEVLALVNFPNYDNNFFARGISAENYKELINDPEKPMFNRSISGEYPPGSTFKPLVAAAALEENVISENTRVDCRGGIRIGNYNFPDWKIHGITDVRKAIAESCDVFFYAVGGGAEGINPLGIEKIKKYADYFQMGKKTGIDLPGEANGLIPDKKWKEENLKERWYVGDDYHCAIGQAFVTATPLQIVNYISSIANGGTVYQPRLVKKIVSIKGEEKEIGEKILYSDFISKKNIKIVKEGMREAISSEGGSAKQLADLDVQVAGKTGTAQFGSENKTHGWFVSFAPYENPEIALVVLMEGGGEGHSTAVPVTKEIYKWYFNEKNQ